jgi:hypothetical protein
MHTTPSNNFHPIWQLCLDLCHGDTKQASRMLLAAIELVARKESNNHATV